MYVGRSKLYGKGAVELLVDIPKWYGKPGTRHGVYGVVCILVHIRPEIQHSISSDIGIARS